MMNVAVLVANAQYATLSELSCCKDDLLAMKELLNATNKYGEIVVVEDADADTLKSEIRRIIHKVPSIGELFFYFTGHGFLREDSFFHCATDFDQERPHTTGLSVEDLHSLLRMAQANTVVKVIDACNSGTSLVKADQAIIAEPKNGLQNLIQISSCLDSQNALTGDPLSLFTQKFRSAVLRKTVGAVYYSDVISSLRDEFIHNNDQTPHFVSQGTGRERFVDDAEQLSELRQRLTPAELSTQGNSEQPASEPAKPLLRDLLQEAERDIATRDRIYQFSDEFFDGLIKRVSNDEVSDFFDLDTAEHADFPEPTSIAFITRVLAKEERSDNFVSADIRTERRQNPWNVLGAFSGDRQSKTYYDLQLNCAMKRAQIRFTFVPKYHSIDQLVLVVTCAPSLEKCYIFEVVSRHGRVDFDVFDDEGNEVTRKWYKMGWSDESTELVKKICSSVYDIVREHLELTSKRLMKE